MEFLEKINKIIESEKRNISKNSLAFLQRIYEEGIDKYKKRLTQYDFQNYNRVLDAGCGFGQWSLGLAQMNEEVFSFDVDPFRIQIFNKIYNSLGYKNIKSFQSEIIDIRYPDNFFDIIFCYGVIFLTPWREGLTELWRVLKPGGKIYVNANGIGWYKNLWYNEPNKTKDYDPKLIAAKVLFNTLCYKRNLKLEKGVDVLIEPEELVEQLKNFGAINIILDDEGKITFPNFNDKPDQSFFKGHYLGDRGVYEVIAEKPTILD